MKPIERNKLILFPSAVCNLNCTYCNISKNSALKQIDNELERFFQQPEEILARVKKYFHPASLTTLEFWGGEPTLHIERVFNILQLLLNNYPYLNSFFLSSNFSYPGWERKIYDLLNQFRRFPNRYFNICLQLSCDGPEELNDLGRGKNTTKKCLVNFQTLLKRLSEMLPDNVFLDFTLKPTLSIETFKLLNTKEKIISYYRFFENNFWNPVVELNSPNIKFWLHTPNMGVPCPATIQDGRDFAQFCKDCDELSRESEKYFQYYKDVRPFSISSQHHSGSETYYGFARPCGIGNCTVGLLPNNKISVCHEGFTQLLKEYRQYQLTETGASTIEKHISRAQHYNLCYTEEEYDDFEDLMCSYCYQGGVAHTVSLVAQIRLLAYAGQILPEYKQEVNALHAAHALTNECNCFKDNYNVSGSFTLRPVGLMRLLLNGALPYVEGTNDISARK